MSYYVLDENNNRQEAYSKEEILSLLDQAIQDGTLANISKDAGFITKLKCACTGTTIKEAFITQEQYNALKTAGTLEPNTLYNIIDDTTCQDINEALETLDDKINTNTSAINNNTSAINNNANSINKLLNGFKKKSVECDIPSGGTDVYFEIPTNENLILIGNVWTEDMQKFPCYIEYINSNTQEIVVHVRNQTGSDGVTEIFIYYLSIPKEA